jgi:hypothetical protein
MPFPLLSLFDPACEIARQSRQAQAPRRDRAGQPAVFESFGTLAYFFEIDFKL